MKERPILFSGSMVRALLDGRKTMTRRVCKELDHTAERLAVEWASTHCPYGVPGDRLWVRETWRNGTPMLNGPDLNGAVAYRADYPDSGHLIKWRPSIFMPRRASRITLEIVSVRVERVQDISEADAKAEGVRQPVPGSWYRHVKRDCYRCGFEALWDSINAKRGYGWDVNPWVWIIEFKQIGGAP